MIETHCIASADFATLITGGGSAATVTRLRDGQYSLVLLRICAMLELTHDADPGERRQLTDAMALFSLAQERSPSAVLTTLLYPQVGAWAGHCLRRLRRDGPGTAASLLGHAAAVAAVAAIRAGVEFEIDVPAPGGKVMLPGLGLATLAPGKGTCGAVIRGGPAGAEVACDADGETVRVGGESAGPGWQELRRLRVTADDQVLDVILDDLDPFRDCHGLGASDRQSATDIACWHDMLAGAWTLLARDHWNFAEGIAAGLTSLIPLAATGEGHGLSATSADAFGSCALSGPADPVSLAATLVHEFQHAKLSALQNFVPLHTSTEEACFYSPWRDDPRPLWGLMHGAYAFLGVTDFWRRRRQVRSGDVFADFEFARWREQTRRALLAIGASGQLTDTGERLVAGMTAHADQWQDPVPGQAQALARRAVMDHEVSWQLRNVRLDPAPVARLAAAWRTGAPRPPEQVVPASVMPSRRALQDNARLDLIHLLLREPARFTALCRAGHDGDGPGDPSPYTVADIDYASGDFSRSAERYREQIAADPSRTHAWAGLVLALAAADRETAGEACQILLDRPTLVAAVCRAVRAQGAVLPEPERLAFWLENVTHAHGVGGSMSKS